MRRYYCERKKKHGLHCEAIADANRKVLWYDVSCTPTTHDYVAFKSTGLGYRIYHGDLPEPYYIIGDSAYVCGRFIVTPGDCDSFNYEHSRVRMAVECAFGEIVRRWGILWQPLEMKFNRRARFVGACIKLHNFCVDRRLELEEGTIFEDWTDRGRQRAGRRVPPPMDREGRPDEQLLATHRRRGCRRVRAGADRDFSSIEAVRLEPLDALLALPCTRLRALFLLQVRAAANDFAA